MTKLMITKHVRHFRWKIQIEMVRTLWSQYRCQIRRQGHREPIPVTAFLELTTIPSFFDAI